MLSKPLPRGESGEGTYNLNLFQIETRYSCRHERYWESVARSIITF